MDFFKFVFFLVNTKIYIQLILTTLLNSQDYQIIQMVDNQSDYQINH